MPKVCSYDKYKCKLGHFAGGYCRRHQWCRKDKQVVVAIDKVSKKQSGRMSKYIPIKDKFLKDNPTCAVGIPGCLEESTNVHHGKGRIGKLLFDTKYFIPCCSGPCHRWCEDHPEKAKELNLSFNRTTVN